jgi:hypothetical protein
VRDVPQARRIVEVLPPVIEILLVLPLDTVEALRHLMFVVPHAHQGMEERDIQPSSNPGRRAHVQEFRLHQLPHQGVFLSLVHQVPRCGRTRR